MRGALGMHKLSYFAVFEPTKDGAYGIYFPDLPGCISYGKSFEEAGKNASEALSLHIYGMEKDGDEIPEPSKTPQIDTETARGYIISPITIYPDLVRNELDNKAVRTNITLPSWLKDIAEANNVNYSHVMQTALLELLGLQNKER